MGPLMSSGFGRDGSRPDTAIAPDLAEGVLASILVSLVSVAMCTDGTAALLARSRRPNIPLPRACHHRTLSGDSRTSCSAKAEHRRSEGSLPSGADHRATPLYSVDPRGIGTMMQSCASAAKLRGGGPILRNGVNTMVGFG